MYVLTQYGYCMIVGDDAVGVRWADLSADLQLYASHSDFLRKVALRHSAHWQ